ncbi:hypothetical protein NG827_14760 [Xanthomonas sacchari]|nr:hypothetical protein [Xanthomonas sacchari]UYK83720.1 hypothetical protein NG827_14760 [Xanthomonas sacchari]
MSSDGIPEAEHERVAAEARAWILKWTGIPCCVGIGPTKTLAKLGNKASKKTPHGVMTALPGSLFLEWFKVEDMWGVGHRHRTRAKLDVEGILAAADLASADHETGGVVSGLHDSVGSAGHGEVDAAGLATTLGTPSFCIAFA